MKYIKRTYRIEEKHDKAFKRKAKKDSISESAVVREYGDSLTEK